MHLQAKEHEDTWPYITIWLTKLQLKSMKYFLEKEII